VPPAPFTFDIDAFPTPKMICQAIVLNAKNAMLQWLLKKNDLTHAALHRHFSERVYFNFPRHKTFPPGGDKGLLFCLIERKKYTQIFLHV
jgi:hypothetical protein